MRRFSSKTGGRLTGYVTDIEGDYQFWRRYVEISKVFIGTANPSLREGCSFVFGGDAIDKGGMDLAVLRELVALKDRYPTRVHLILGNRDINKMRFREELNLPSVGSHPGTYWRPGAPSHSIGSSDQVNIAKWMLEKTMGCPNTFELRRSELMKARGEGTPISDDDVASSLLRSVADTDGEVIQYLRRANLAVVLDDVLFVHGAITKVNLGMVPTEGSGDSWKRIPFEPPNCSPSPIRSWVSELNQWAHSQIDSFSAAQQPRYDDDAVVPWAFKGGFSGSPGCGLLQYGMGSAPNRVRIPGIVYATVLRKGALFVLYRWTAG